MANKVVIVAGGTGGHIFPGLAVAQKLINLGYIVEWIGTKQGLEAELIPQNNIKIHYINISGFRGKNVLTKVLSLIKICISIIQSLKLLIKINPQIVLGMGGFVSGPVGIAAWLLKKRLVIHEQNAIAGTSNRILGFFADRILISFINSFPNKRVYSSKIYLTGNPIRNDFNFIDHKIIAKNNDLFKILVLGGSQGSRFLNEIIPITLGNIDGIKIFHQTGKKDFHFTVNLYLANNVEQSKYELTAFIDNIVAKYLEADLIICRAGATTIFEIMATGSASILVPLPWSIDNHQACNAKYLTDYNAAILMDQKNITSEKLRDLILDLKNNSNKLQLIKTNLINLWNNYKTKDSAKMVAELILNSGTTF